jgi:hypothetical protein
MKMTKSEIVITLTVPETMRRRASKAIEFNETWIRILKLARQINPKIVIKVTEAPDTKRVHSQAFDLLTQLRAMDNPAMNAAFAHLIKEEQTLAFLQLAGIRADVFKRFRRHETLSKTHKI